MEFDMNDEEKIRKILSENVCSVTFTKKDGADRLMICTTNMNEIPEEHHPKSETSTTPQKPSPEGLLKVFDIENTGWRSFYANTVTQFVIGDITNGK